MQRRTRSCSADFNDLNVSDIGTFKLHEEGKLMDFDVNILPQGGIYGCAITIGLERVRSVAHGLWLDNTPLQRMISRHISS